MHNINTELGRDASQTSPLATTHLSQPRPPKKKRLPIGSIKLQFAGDLILARCKLKGADGLFNRYSSLFEGLANTARNDRLVSYKLLNALMLTSYAKKTKSTSLKQDLFQRKNALFIDIATHSKQKKMVDFKYLVSKNIRVVKYCGECATHNKNTKETDKHKRKRCKDCTIDTNFFNVVSMYNQYQDGGARIFLSHDQISNLPSDLLKYPTPKGRKNEIKEEATYKNFHYTVNNLDAIHIDSILEMHERISGK